MNLFINVSTKATTRQNGNGETLYLPAEALLASVANQPTFVWDNDFTYELMYPAFSSPNGLHFLAGTGLALPGIQAYKGNSTTPIPLNVISAKVTALRSSVGLDRAGNAIVDTLPIFDANVANSFENATANNNSMVYGDFATNGWSMGLNTQSIYQNTVGYNTLVPTGQVTQSNGINTTSPYFSRYATRGSGLYRGITNHYLPVNPVPVVSIGQAFSTQNRFILSNIQSSLSDTAFWANYGTLDNLAFVSGAECIVQLQISIDDSVFQNVSTAAESVYIRVPYTVTPSFCWTSNTGQIIISDTSLLSEEVINSSASGIYGSFVICVNKLPQATVAASQSLASSPIHYFGSYTGHANSIVSTPSLAWRAATKSTLVVSTLAPDSILPSIGDYDVTGTTVGPTSA